MNSTPNYGLSQIEASDKPTWLQMYNSDMLKIDTGMEENKTAAAGNGTKINQIETNLEQVTQTVQNQGTTLQEYGSTLTQHTTLIGQNSQNISKLQGSVDELVQLVDERDNDIWVFLEGTNGIGIKDGTWKTSWIGYALEYINRSDTRVVVLTNQGAGMQTAGVNGNNFLGMLQNAQISNKNLVTRILVGSIRADYGVNNYTTSWLQFMQYVRNNFINATVEYLGYYYNYSNNNDISWWLENLTNISSAGVLFNNSFNNSPFIRSYFDGYNYNDNGQHEIGKRMASYLVYGDYITTSSVLTDKPSLSGIVSTAQMNYEYTGTGLLVDMIFRFTLTSAAGNSITLVPINSFEYLSNLFKTRCLIYSNTITTFGFLSVQNGNIVLTEIVGAIPINELITVRGLNNTLLHYSY